ncbi:protein of unknown function [Methylorubrum extorquens]|uniref:Uncharacterized protein n=1 Tax=Methylorubrum extorquens TaxID=408 RepID=A0A2N9AVX4_METEX|nr:protein of unknown function [Methylorubrum extorquens]
MSPVSHKSVSRKGSVTGRAQTHSGILDKVQRLVPETASYLSRRAPKARRFLLGFEPGPTVTEQLVAAIGAQAMRPCTSGSRIRASRCAR